MVREDDLRETLDQAADQIAEIQSNPRAWLSWMTYLLERLEGAARGSQNLMPLFIECVENDITLGEICGVLRGLWGEYHPPSTL